MAMKECCGYYIRGLHYKLRMMGIPVTNLTCIAGDNQSVLWNTSKPDSMLKKKCNLIAHHCVQEGAAKDEWITGYINTVHNPLDMMTKALKSGENRKRKVSSMLYDLYPG